MRRSRLAIRLTALLLTWLTAIAPLPAAADFWDMPLPPEAVPLDPSQAAEADETNDAEAAEPVGETGDADAPGEAVETDAVEAEDAAAPGEAEAAPQLVNEPVLGLPEGSRVDDSFFDYTLFVGDSVTLKLNNYVRKQRHGANPKLLGSAVFFTAGGVAIADLLDPVSKNSCHPTLKGQKMTLEDAVAKSGARKVYIMLGMNDIAVFGPEGSVNNMMELLRRVREKSPKVEIYLESSTPRLKQVEQERLNNESLREYNRRLCAAAESSGMPGIYFVDVASAFRGPDGALPLEYCSDPESLGIHFTDEACEIWIDYLYTHTPA